MISLLDPAARSQLRELAARDCLLAFDFDGTLAPIVERPDDAAMRLSTRRLLSRVAQLYPVAVISGRAQADVRARLGPVPVWEVVGNHGLEPSPAAERFEAEVRRWMPALHARLDGLAGVVIEDKGLSVAVHYRASSERQAAREAIAAAAAALENVRAIGGKEVVNLVPIGGPSKGDALRRICEKLGCASALYAGDDETDEDVFALQPPPVVLGVRIGPGESSRAGFVLEDQPQIDALLEALVGLRERPALRPGPRARR